MKSKMKVNLLLIALIMMALASCNSESINKSLMGGTPDTMYNPSNKPDLDTSEINKTIEPLQVDSSGEATGRMNNTGKGG